MRIITLCTDFGLRDWFVAAMKGVILNIQPRAIIVDITHQVPAGDIRAGAFAVAASYRFFPRHTIHVAVVDPGVGSNRLPIAVATKDYTFAGPDNGLFSLALSGQSVKTIHRLENQKFFSKAISRTFHGRDIFAPAAAHLSKGTPVSEMGSELGDYQKLHWPMPNLEKTQLRGEVIYIDRFGNAITNIQPQHLSAFDLDKLKITVPGTKRSIRFGRFYQEAESGKALGLFGSTDFLEIAVNGGDAGRLLKLKIGDPIIISALGG
jgi:S-adenosylmethionine hydrolase